MLKNYTIQIWYSKEDNCYLAKVLEFESCMAHGSTPEQALKEIKIAGEGMIELMIELGKELPEPIHKADIA